MTTATGTKTTLIEVVSPRNLEGIRIIAEHDARVSGFDAVGRRIGLLFNQAMHMHSANNRNGYKSGEWQGQSGLHLLYKVIEVKDVE